MTTKKNKYGSIPEIINSSDALSGISNEQEEYYPIENTQYITESNSVRRKRCMNALAPILIFVMIMGSIAFALSKDFNHLYPGHGGGGPVGGTVQHTPAVVPAQDGEETAANASATTTSSSSSKDENKERTVKSQSKNNSVTSNSHPECSYHSECYKLNLTGSCCPTVEGIMLECCL
mmetsp:Transcript_8064/g.15187  ORF Transcript_8064/g.15187 Transcript_8064/m.15187 type:complete len:177 (+) Transcript_8064:58-588(+)